MGTADISFPVPNVSAIIERQHRGVTQVLLQVRWKPARDPVYSGALEIPAGGIDLYENVYDAMRREVFEETGLRVIGFRPDVKTKTHSHQGDDVFAFVLAALAADVDAVDAPRHGLAGLGGICAARPVPIPGRVAARPPAGDSS